MGAIPPVTPPATPATSTLTVEVRALSARVGANDVRVLVRRGDAPVSGASVALTSAMASMDLGTERIAAPEVIKGEYRATVHFSMAGPWRVNVTASEGGQTATSTLIVNAR